MITANHSLKIYLILQTISLLTISCVTPYEPDISKYEHVFVVDGELNNLPGPYEVKLLTGFKFDEDAGTGLSGAKVKIIEDTGLEIDLTEAEAGIYRTSDSSFTAKTGFSYKLQINYNGDVFESEFETLKEPVPIDSIYWVYQEETDGIQILLNTHDQAGNTRYYAWDYLETWKFYVPIVPNDHPEWEVCFRNSKSYGFIIGSTIQRYEDRIEEYPLLLIGSNTNRLRWRYSILVRQYSLSGQAYEYYKNLGKLNENQGTLFDPVPFSLTGNMKCLTDKNKPVLGYFLVSGVSEKRIFINRTDLPQEFRPVTGYESCNSQYLTLQYEQLAIPYDSTIHTTPFPYDLSKTMGIAEVDSIKSLGYSIFDSFVNRTPSDTVVFLSFAQPFCFNCTLNGYNKAPDFWKEED
ncbi:MAG: DUF4249 domain-containing protein [Bacteroidales bacterium]|nr:DUF4249 domain-containing protein [Bacteroidales bacterium]